MNFAKNMRALLFGALFVSAISAILNCDPAKPEDPAVLGLTPVTNKTIGFSDPVDCVYEELAFVLTVTDENIGDVVFAAQPMPRGATLNTATGEFSWTPTIADFGSYTVVYSASAGGKTVHDTAAITVATPVLNDTSVFKIVSPNGNESFDYGDTIQVMWLQNINVCGNGMLRFAYSAWYCQAWSSQDEYLIWTEDRDSTAASYFRAVNDTVAVAVQQIVLEDAYIVAADCNLKFQGDSMVVVAYDEYDPPGCTNCQDNNDAFFSVVK